MNNVKVSVIMPVYNVENYVGRAIESIQNQTLTDWEFFAVDDGTPDNSGKICDEYAAKDPRIKVIHKENGGAPSARNVAIDKAVGKYMYFMDSDDWAEKPCFRIWLIWPRKTIYNSLFRVTISTHITVTPKNSRRSRSTRIRYTKLRLNSEPTHTTFLTAIFFTLRGISSSRAII